MESGLEQTEIVKRLKGKGLKVTPQRFAIYANLLSRADHPTAEQLLTDLNKDFPVSSQATVYTSVQLLKEVGLVREVLLEQGIARYDGNVAPHHHFQCRECKAIADIAWEKLSQVDLSQLGSGLVAESYEVTVHGLCDNCARSKTQKPDLEE
ncbi:MULTISPECIES: Fur family transcriptional regulator [Limnospira]|jgi:Fur family peroxide stress response transcriptional regulator|uniref:Fur family transcriptional regulator n=1 Tax=Limnospira platensis NIES-46 TaxID=1236695 RepID=A0A5M3T6N5_LIMPL|nr:Fur family transcriptional regulator [Arthrospira platensis]KDR58542.1 transcriptional regulator [Arthrospira platensis str. Paraca]MDF2207650.1 Fur family transcriptional regulator [Arthrospira platensis NCB002]MDT9183841.1 Fur family transcriptional regulator [Limnospira sp. PMC 289.06]MDT9296077.1 Fur family transcriptional regulator [Arthrospira platensis PCC 7345]MDT9310487.1 Fur family transcriptional regulator [Limnospira sp. Paracas R14]BAI93093.1 Fur family transcriptional regulat